MWASSYAPISRTGGVRRRISFAEGPERGALLRGLPAKGQEMGAARFAIEEETPRVRASASARRQPDDRVGSRRRGGKNGPHDAQEDVALVAAVEPHCLPSQTGTDADPQSHELNLYGWLLPGATPG